MSVIDRPVSLRQEARPEAVPRAGRAAGGRRSGHPVNGSALDGSVALVTGSSGGIGAAIARRLTDSGARVVLHGQDGEGLHELAAELAAPAIPADFASHDGVLRLAEGARRTHGRVDLVVHCAGIGHYGEFAAMSAGTLDRLLDVDLRAALQLTRALLPGMLASGRGHLCFVGSIAGLTGVANEAVYSAAKAGLSAFAQALRLELSGTGVDVSSLCLGAVDTPFFERRGAAYTRRVPRPWTPDRVAEQVVAGIAAGGGSRVLPRWLNLAPTLRLLSPRLYDSLALRFG